MHPIQPMSRVTQFLLPGGPRLASYAASTGLESRRLAPSGQIQRMHSGALVFDGYPFFVVVKGNQNEHRRPFLWWTFWVVLKGNQKEWVPNKRDEPTFVWWTGRPGHRIPLPLCQNVYLIMITSTPPKTPGFGF